jgi:epsilon-lactone hydrolase
MSATVDEQGSLHLPPRVIPIPSSISTQARQALAAPPIAAGESWPATQDKATWHAFVAERNDRISQLYARLPPFAGEIRANRVGSATVFELSPAETNRPDRTILYLHGGAYVTGGGDLAAKAAESLAIASHTIVHSVDYRMPPDHVFPAALDDVIAAYREMLNRYAAARIVVMGASAGAGLAAAAILKLRDIGLPLPGGAILLSPEADLTESGDTFETNQYIDVILQRRLTAANSLYAAGHDLRDPYLSPVFGDFRSGYPPTLLISGTRDLFLSNTVRLHRELRRARIRADLHVFEAMPHGGFFGAPEDAESVGIQLEFLEDIFHS